MGHGDFDLGAAHIKVTCPKLIQLEMVSKVLAPLMGRLQRAGHIRGWTYRCLDDIYLSARVPGAESPSESAAQLSESLNAALSKVSLSAAPVESDEIGATENDALARFGGPFGYQLIRLFARRDTSLCLEILSGVEPDSLDLRFNLYFYFFDVLGISPENLNRSIEEWIRRFSAAFGQQGPALLDQAREEVRLEFQADPGIPEKLECLLRRGWKACSSERFREILGRHERAMRRIGRALASERMILPPDKSREFVIFHSYCHLHNFRMGRAGFIELRDCVAIEAALRSLD
jgi:hypothetical protein